LESVFPPVPDPAAEALIVTRDGDAREIKRGPVPLSAMILDAELLELTMPNMLLDGFVDSGGRRIAGKRGEGTRILKDEALGMSINPKKMTATASVRWACGREQERDRDRADDDDDDDDDDSFLMPRRVTIVVVVAAAAISKAWNSTSDRMPERNEWCGPQKIAGQSWREPLSVSFLVPRFIFVVPRFPSKSGLIHKHIVKTYPLAPELERD
jgi:hypothetical protein